MGLDTTIYLFSKSVYDELEDEKGRVEYYAGRGKGVELCYYRKHQSLQDILGHVCNGEYDQTTYHKLDKERVVRAIKLSHRLSKNKDARWDREELVVLARDLMRIVGLIDFNVATPSFLWIS